MCPPGLACPHAQHGLQQPPHPLLACPRSHPWSGQRCQVASQAPPWRQRSLKGQSSPDPLASHMLPPHLPTAAILSGAERNHLGNKVSQGWLAKQSLRPGPTAPFSSIQKETPN